MSAKVGGGDEGGVYDEINITPMLDLAYVLLVIFIIMTTASVQGIKVNLPKAADTPSLAKPAFRLSAWCGRSYAADWRSSPTSTPCSSSKSYPRKPGSA